MSVCFAPILLETFLQMFVREVSCLPHLLTLSCEDLIRIMSMWVCLSERRGRLKPQPDCLSPYEAGHFWDGVKLPGNTQRLVMKTERLTLVTELR